MSEPRRLRVFDWNSRWFWVVIFWQGRRFRVERYGPQRWGRWLNVWKWEPMPDMRGSAVGDE